MSWPQWIYEYICKVARWFTHNHEYVQFEISLMLCMYSVYSLWTCIWTTCIFIYIEPPTSHKKVVYERFRNGKVLQTAHIQINDINQYESTININQSNIWNLRTFLLVQVLLPEIGLMLFRVKALTMGNEPCPPRLSRHLVVMNVFISCLEINKWINSCFWFLYPYHPCMVYLPTFTIKLW